MRICLIPLRIEIRNPTSNLLHFKTRLAEVMPYQPDLICLPECAFTGYLYSEQDFERYAELIPGETTRIISELAKENRCYICFGMLEKAEEGVYSSAVLLDRSGQIVLRHRKIHEKPPFVTGKEVRAVETEFGRLAILLCGDLFADEVKAMLDRHVRAVILPLARSFNGKSPDLDRWLSQERQAYTDEIKKAGVTILLVNSLEDSRLPDASFGGAMIVSSDGEILAEAQHGTDQALLFDLDFAQVDREADHWGCR